MRNETGTSKGAERPTLATWLNDRGIKWSFAAEKLGIQDQRLRRILKPFGDPGRRKPDDELIERIVEYTAGEITAADFYPAHLRPRSASLEAAA